MARSFSVYRSEDRQFVQKPPTDDVYSQAYEEWERECVRRRLCEGDLGNEASIRIHWSEPASRLQLPLLASIYDDGFYRGCDWSGADLDSLAAELEILAAHWRSERVESDLLQRLEDRAASLGSAIDIARKSGAFLLIA